MEGGQGGDEAEEVGRDPGDEVRVHKADTRDTDDAKVWRKGKEPVEGDLVVEVGFILLYGGVVPDEHDRH